MSEMQTEGSASPLFDDVVLSLFDLLPSGREPLQPIARELERVLEAESATRRGSRGFWSPNFRCAN